MVPLAEKLRPKSLNEFIGQKHLIGPQKPLRIMLDNAQLRSMIFWGPPGSGKTSLARLIAETQNAEFIELSAIDSGKADVKKVVDRAGEIKQLYGKETILFLDEIHRFNKAQQDFFLPYVEKGTIILIGATTENPGFEINAPLLSRTQLMIFARHNDEEIKEIINRAVLEYPKTKWTEETIEMIVNFANGDARNAISAIEASGDLNTKITPEILTDILQKKFPNYDKKGDAHYDTISAFIKSMRGSDPDATLHYLARMLRAGEDPMFIARRLVIFASEDVGNANPEALMLATNAMQAVHMIGLPEAQLILSQTATYLATSKKSIASSNGIFEALADVDEKKLDPIPLHLRNPKNKLMKQLGYGKDYIRYPWLEEQKSGKKINQDYLPKNLLGKKYYIPDWE